MMISVALVLFLIIGINQVFKMTSDTVGAGQVLSSNVRDSRAVQSVMFSDLAGAVMQNPPAMIIASSRVSAFRNPTDRLSDRDTDPLTTDLDNNNVEGDNGVLGEDISPATYNFRSHRTDRLAFFARDVYRRQTGDDGTFASATGSNEAYIWYGHLRMPNNDSPVTATSYKGPGAETFATNQNNFDASQFSLGRMAMLMRDPRDPAFITAAEEYYPRTNPVPLASSGLPTPPNLFLSPFAWGVMDSGGGGPIQDSRYDLAGITIAQFAQDVRDRSVGTPPSEPLWWQRLLYAGPLAAITAPRPADEDYRFRADRLFAKPLDSQKAALLAPILLSGCGQFIVEYAGDYIGQDGTTGARTSLVPDNIPDFVIDNATGTPVRSTRWYGMPRDVSGSTTGGPDGIILAGTAAAPSVDVVPLRDVRGAADAAPFERAVAFNLPPPPPAGYLVPGGMAPEARYDCVWGPDYPLEVAANPLPQMLRITVVLEDPSGRLAEGQAYEFVIDLP
ncbi:MAG: hypothetical protein WBD40_00980 [Tepidisphaeraceae bacterium]